MYTLPKSTWYKINGIFTIVIVYKPFHLHYENNNSIQYIFPYISFYQLFEAYGLTGHCFNNQHIEFKQK